MMKIVFGLLASCIVLCSGFIAGAENVGDARLEMIGSTERILDRDDLGFRTKPAYPRVHMLNDGVYMLAWQETIPGRGDDNGRYVRYALSNDLSSWTQMGYLFKDKRVTNVYGADSERLYSCPEMLALSSGDIVAVCCFWNMSSYSRIEGRADNGIALKRSSDNGRTWSDEEVIFYGQSWEPFLLERPDGTLQCYFSEARPWIASANSGTSLVESADAGRTWTPAPGHRPRRVMRKKYWNPVFERYQFTDQMPTGAVLDADGKMAFAMEDYDMGKYSLGIVFSPTDGEWEDIKGAEAGPDERIDSLSVNATGPYIVRFPGGEVLVTFTRNQGMEWPLLYRIGDCEAKMFGPEHKAFDRGGWSSACVDSDDTVVLVAPYAGGRLHIARFKLIRDN